MICQTTTDRVIENHRCYRLLNRYSVFMTLLIGTASLVGIGSVYQPAEVQTQLQSSLASPPEVVEAQLLQPPLAPPPGLPPIQLPGLPPIQLPGLPPIQPQTPQQQSSGGPGVR